MPTLDPGSKRAARPTPRAQPLQRGFTLLELLIVITVIALSTGLSILALRDSSRDQLEQEAARLSALLEAARMESRASGQAVTWRPVSAGIAPGASAARAAPMDFVFEPPLHRASGLTPGSRPTNSPAPITTAGSGTGTAEAWPVRWLHEGTQAEVIGAPRLLLGPEPLIPPQRLRLRRGEQQLILATDGLGAFRVESTP